MAEHLKQKLQSLFTEKLINVECLNANYDNTNNVYSVITNNENTYIVKALKDTNINRTAFWQGLNLLFNKTLEDSINSQTAISDCLNQCQSILAKKIPVPVVLQSDPTNNNSLKTPYIIMSKMDGKSVLPDSDEAASITKNGDIAYQMGHFIASVHAQQFEYFGNMSEEKLPLNEFPDRLASTIKKLGSSRKAREHPEVQQLLPRYIALAKEMVPPNSAGIIMLDLWPTQFLLDKLDNNKLAALVDIESYVIGPLGLELVLIELWLGYLGKFKEGYLSTGTVWPDFEKERDLYRFFLYLLYGLPGAGLDACLDSRAKFAQGDRVKSRLEAPRPRPGGYGSPFGPGA